MDAILSELKTHNTRNRKKKVALATFFLLSILFLIADILIGSQGLSLSNVLSAIFTPESSTFESRVIVWDVRMPMSLMAPLVGGALALAGAQMQTTLNNPLADPYIFGASGPL